MLDCVCRHDPHKDKVTDGNVATRGDIPQGVLVSPLLYPETTHPS